MSRVRIFLLILCITLLMGSASATNSKVIVCLGDSITHGEDWGTPYPIQLNDMMPGSTVYNKGEHGDTTAGLLARYATDVNSYHPDYVVIFIGTNDISNGIPLATIESNLQTLYQWAVANNTTPVLCTVSPGSGRSYTTIESLNTWIKNYAVSNNFSLVDLYTLLDSPAAPRTGVLNVMYDSGDGLHPQTVGLHAIAQAVYRGINSNKYLYSTSMNITNQSSSQWITVLKTLNYSNISSAKADFSDIYLTRSDGITPVPFWIENQTNSTSAKMWVLLPPSTSQITINYGNNSSISQSNGYSAFYLFDHFENNTTKYGWNTPTIGFGGSYSIANSTFILTGGTSSYSTLVSKASVGAGYAYRANASIGTASYSMLGFVLTGTPDRWLSHTYNYPTANIINAYAHASDGVNAVSSDEGAYQNAYHIYEVDRPASGSSPAFSVDDAGALTLSYTQNGTMPATMFANSPSGVMSADWISLRVFPSTLPTLGDPATSPVVPDFSANATAIWRNGTIAFTDSTTGSPTAWNWNFGDGTANSTLQNPTHTYTTNGTYTVSLTASNAGNSATATKTSYITVSTADFTRGGNGKAWTGWTVTFTDTSGGSPTSWLWNFGDGSNSTAQNPSHIYSTVGNFTVTLTVSNAQASTTVTKANCVAVYPAITPSFTASPTTTVTGRSVAFTDTSLGSPTSWVWNFGDSTNSALQNPTHSYSSTGIYTITLTASNPAASIQSTKPNYIHIYTAFSQNFASNVTNGVAGVPIAFTDTTTFSADNVPTSWAWNFGDGATSNVQNPIHTYATPGAYSVTLTVSSAVQSNTVAKSITIYPSVVCNFSANVTQTMVGFNIGFTDLSTGSPTQWLWNFGDGTTSTLQNPAHRYSDNGVYTVSLTASNNVSSQTKTGNIIASDAAADFNANPLSGNVPMSVHFVDNSTSGLSPTWSWNFGDGGTSVDQNPSHTYGNVGTYTVTLTVSSTDANGTIIKEATTKANYISVINTSTATRVSFVTTASPSSTTVGFHDSSVGDVASYNWDFGDGDTSSEQNPTHTYSTGGVFTVTLTTADSKGAYTSQSMAVGAGDVSKSGDTPENYTQYSKKMFTPNMTIWDIPQNTMNIYTSFIPLDVFWLMIMIIMFIPLYIRTGSILLPCILYLFTGGFCAVFMPAYFSTMALWMVLLGVTGTIYKLFIQD